MFSMNSFEKYRRSQRSGFNSDSHHLTSVAKNKFKLYHKSLVRTSGSSSSVSLPVWNIARLNNTLNRLSDAGYSMSRTDLMIAVLKLYLVKLRKHEQLIDRNRKKNTDNVKYVKVSTYCHNYQWERLQAQTAATRICLSHALDIAIRIYLKAVEGRLLRPALNHLKTGWNSVSSNNIFFRSLQKRTLECLLNLGKYQKILAKQGKLGQFLYFQFGYSPNIRVKTQKNLTFL